MDQTVYQGENLAGYRGEPCVYVRWIDETQQFYIGDTLNLFRRYCIQKLAEVIYFETFGPPVARASGDLRGRMRERMQELLVEFEGAGEALANGEKQAACFCGHFGRKGMRHPSSIVP